MSKRPPYGNLTAALVIAATLELVTDRLVGRLFLSPGCHSAVGCLVLQAGPFFFHLTGALSVMVASAAIAGLLGRGELFPRGVRLTVAVLSLVFLLLVALSLVIGHMPSRYQTHLLTSFAFVIALLALSVIGSGATPRARAGIVLFAIPGLLHVTAVIASRAGWWRSSWIGPDRLTTGGEVALLLAAATSPGLLLGRRVPRPRLGAALAFAAGSSAFFTVALLGRYDLVQTIALYGVHIELPRALSFMGVCYALALFGFVTTLAASLMSPGAPRLIGLGLALLAIGGYQTSAPTDLSVELCGLLAMATGAARAPATARATPPRLASDTLRSWLTSVAAALADPRATLESPQLIEVTEGDGAGWQRATVRVARGACPVALELARANGVVRELSVTVGSPGPDAPDATIESHETWLGKRPEDRVRSPRARTGDSGFDRKMGVYGRAPLGDRHLRRKILRLADGTFTLWTGSGARFVASAPAGSQANRHALAAGAAGTRVLVDLVDTLGDLIRASEAAAPPDTAG